MEAVNTPLSFSAEFSHKKRPRLTQLSSTEIRQKMNDSIVEGVLKALNVVFSNFNKNLCYKLNLRVASTKFNVKKLVASFISISKC